MKHRTWRRPNWRSAHRSPRRRSPLRGARGASTVWSTTEPERCTRTSTVRRRVAADRAANDVRRQVAADDPPCARDRATRGRSHRSCEPGQFRRTPPPYGLPPARTGCDTPARLTRTRACAWHGALDVDGPSPGPFRARSQASCSCWIMWRMMGGYRPMSLPPEQPPSRSYQPQMRRLRGELLHRTYR
jgi:hypothetical protein